MEKRITFGKFAEEFNKANEEGRVAYGVIVYASTNWKKPYSVEARSYATHSDQWGWDASKMGHCRIGYAIDGSDYCRMDYYPWKVEYCYFITEEEFNAIIAKYKN